MTISLNNTSISASRRNTESALGASGAVRTSQSIARSISTVTSRSSGSSSTTRIRPTGGIVAARGRVVASRPGVLAVAAGRKSVTVVPAPGLLSIATCPPDCVTKP